MDENVDLNQEKLELFYNEFGSVNFRSQSEIAKDYEKKTFKLYFKSIDFIYKTLTIIGIVAGFGFTAIGHVKNSIMFIIGEALFFSAIAVGIWATQKYT